MGNVESLVVCSIINGDYQFSKMNTLFWEPLLGVKTGASQRAFQGSFGLNPHESEVFLSCMLQMLFKMISATSGENKICRKLRCQRTLGMHSLLTPKQKQHKRCLWRNPRSHLSKPRSHQWNRRSRKKNTGNLSKHPGLHSL